MNGQWVFGGIERSTDKCVFKVVKDRSKATLLPIIQNWVLPGSIAMSDCWEAYDCLKDLDFKLLGAFQGS